MNQEAFGIDNVVLNGTYNRFQVQALIKVLRRWVDNGSYKYNSDDIVDLWETATGATTSSDKLREQVERFKYNGGKTEAITVDPITLRKLMWFYYDASATLNTLWWANGGKSLGHFLGVYDNVKVDYQRANPSNGMRVTSKDEMKSVYGIDLEG